ncbi:polygalacturonase inhibitor-like [Panicum miliaceum]|uniref:Polygalacturonase inhibitor-like n=1 Tax=Panicum miliaceum TaxID=4540 RepID=A0A3L6SWW2_PANMI|nr:polygalacturonase inhibitor-like [Panicum miliaceum]
MPPLLLSKAGPEAFLTLSHNSLSGTVPAEFAAVSFVQVDLSRNALTGDASVLFGRGKALLVAANLSRNALSFDMSRLDLPERLASLDVSHNAIRGPGGGREPEPAHVLQRQLQPALRRAAERHGQLRGLQLPAQQVPLRRSPSGLPSISC